MSRSLYRRALLALAVVSIAVVLLALALVREERRGLLTVAFLDIGQGDAIYIESPTGRQVLLDAGPGGGRSAPAVLASLAAVMPWYDRTFDLVIPTHPDADHVGGFPAVLERYRVAAFLAPAASGTTATASGLWESLTAEEGAVHTAARRNLRVDLGGGVALDLLYPVPALATADTNASSVVARLSYGARSVLLTGDAPFVLEDRLLAMGDPRLDADILKVGHHGSRTSSGEMFLRAVSPALAVISVGAGNRYGHPTAETLARLEAAGAEIKTTAHEGTVVVVTRGNEWCFGSVSRFWGPTPDGLFSDTRCTP